MTTAWKFTVDYSSPDYTEEEIRNMVSETVNEVSGGAVVRDNVIYLMKFEDAFDFRLRVGHVITQVKKSRVAA